MNLLILCLVLTTLFSKVYNAPSLRILPEHQLPPQLLTLPSNATSIRANIEDGFSCDGRTYGYYADVENDCQLFHVCLPVTYASGRTQVFRWSFICPEETIFNQEMFTCTRADDSIDCMESPRYYNLNRNLNTDNSDSVGHESNDDDQELFGHYRPSQSLLLEPATTTTTTSSRPILGHGSSQHHKPRPQLEPQQVDDDMTSVPEVPQLLELFEQHGVASPGRDREPKPIYSRRIGKI